MANFNEKINSHKEFFLSADGCDYFIERVGSMCQLEREFDYRLKVLSLKVLKGVCRLFIQYKDTCRVQKMAGKCFMWAYTSNPICSHDVRKLCLDSDGTEDLDNFGNPRFEYISGAVLISDKDVCTYGDTWFETVGLEKNHVSCNAYVCGRLVSEFRIPSKVFDRIFGLKENFSELDEEQVKTENDLIEKAKRNVELYIDSLYSTRHKVEQVSGLIQGALIDIEKRRRELNAILSELNNTYYKLGL